MEHVFLLDSDNRMVYVWIWGAFDFLPVLHLYVDELLP